MQVSIGKSDIVYEQNTIRDEILYSFGSLIVYLYFRNQLLLLPVTYYFYKLLFTFGCKYFVKFKTENPNKKIFKFKGWYRVCSSNEIMKGDVKTFKLNNQEIVVYRDHNNKLNAIDPYCTHQNAHLGLGKVMPNGNIRCAFHGWCFDGEGKCKTPNSIISDTCKINKTDKEFDIKSWKVCEKRELIYVWFGSDEPIYTVSDLPTRKKMRHIGTASYTMHTNVIDIIENHVDFLHFYWVHSNHNMPFGLCFDAKPSTVVFNDEEHKMTVTQPAYIQIFGYKIADLNSVNSINSVSTGEFIFSDFVSGSLAVTPIDDNGICVATIDFYLPWYVPAFIAKLLFYMVAVKVPMDDITIWNTKRFTKRPILLKTEFNNIMTFRKYCQKYKINDNDDLIDW